MESIETLAQQLGDVEDRLAALPADAFNERITLREEEREIRSRLREAGHTFFGEDEAAILRLQITDLERRIEAARSARLSASVGAATGYGGGIDPDVAHAVTASLDEAADVATLQRKLQERRVRLAALDER